MEGKNCNFQPISHGISETVGNKAKVTYYWSLIRSHTCPFNCSQNCPISQWW